MHWTTWCSCTPIISPSSPQRKEIFNLTHQLESMQSCWREAKASSSSSQKWENHIHVDAFHSQRIISPWISLIQFFGPPLSGTHIFLELSFRSSLVDLFSWGLTISSVGGYSLCSRPLESFTLLLSHVAGLPSLHSSSHIAPPSVTLSGREIFTLLVATLLTLT